MLLRRVWKQKEQETATQSSQNHVTKPQRWRRVLPAIWITLFCLLSMDINTRLHVYLTDRKQSEVHPQLLLEDEDYMDSLSGFEKKMRNLLELEKSAMINCPHFVLAINKLVSQFYPEGSLSSNTLLQTRNESEADACGEEYRGMHYGYPWYETGFEVSNTCNRSEKLPVSRLVTIVIPECSLNLDSMIDLIESIRDYNGDIPVILGTMASSERRLTLERMFNNLSIVTCTTRERSWPGRMLASMVSLVDTPYTLMARDIFNLTALARLERQIYVISSTDVVGVAGGAFRNETGFWKVGCYQSSIRHYVLKYTQGYKYSALDCMLCDYLQGPFVVKTSILRRYAFRDKMFTQVLFEQWFLELKKANILVMNCPDALYFKSGPVEGPTEMETKRGNKSALRLAKKWDLDRIEYPTRGTYDITCEQLGTQCSTSGKSSTLLIRPCCMLKLTGALKAFDDFAKQNNLDYEIDMGTVFGAVKLGNILPWDKDGDILFRKKDYYTFFTSSKYFREKGYSLSFFPATDYFRLYAGRFYFEMWGVNTMSTDELRHAVWNVSTQVKINGLWMKSTWNPGLYVRNRYGRDLYRHAAHWLDTNKSSSWDSYEPGSWPTCKRNVHPGCLDQYPTDGSEGLLPEHLISQK